jgi:hypothetical protein
VCSLGARSFCESVIDTDVGLYLRALYETRFLKVATHAVVEGCSSNVSGKKPLQMIKSILVTDRGGFSKIRILGAPEQGAPAVSEGAPGLFWGHLTSYPLSLSALNPISGHLSDSFGDLHRSVAPAEQTVCLDREEASGQVPPVQVPPNANSDEPSSDIALSRTARMVCVAGDTFGLSKNRQKVVPKCFTWGVTPHTCKKSEHLKHKL